MRYLSPALNVMAAAARKAGRGLIRDFGELENLQVSLKGPSDFVSTADKRTENQLVEELQRQPDLLSFGSKAGFTAPVAGLNAFVVPSAAGE